MVRSMKLVGQLVPLPVPLRMTPPGPAHSSVSKAASVPWVSTPPMMVGVSQRRSALQV